MSTRLHIVVSEELLGRIDAARGPGQPRADWIRRVVERALLDEFEVRVRGMVPVEYRDVETVEQALGGGGTGATARSAAGSADERPAPAEQFRRAGPDVMSFRRATQR